VAARRNRSASARRRRRLVLVWLVVAVVVAVLAFTTGLLAAPINYDFQPVPPKSVLLLDDTGQPFATIRSPQVENPVTTAQIPMVMRQAIVAAEDQRFFSNSGIEPLAIARAGWRDLTGGNLQGGSTITQQYVKNVYTGSQRTALRKLREASLAIRLEQHLSKDQILTRYLNTLYLGNGTAGVDAASRFYFGVPIASLDLDTATGGHDPALGLARAATLAGIAPAPSDWNPLHDPQQARRRELYVLNQMFKSGDISSDQAAAAYGHALPRVVAATQPDAATIAPEFRDLVAGDLAHFGDETLYNSGGVSVQTTLDLTLQQAAETALRQGLPKRKGLDAAIVAVDPRNGDLRALTERKAGGYVKDGEDVADPPTTDITRSSGSTIKPFTLAAALEHGHTLDEGHYAPECVRITAKYRPCNAEGGAGYYSLQTALEQSINTVYAPLGVSVGLKRVVKLARRAGLRIGHLNSGPSCNAPRHTLCPSYALGVPISPLSEADAYGSFVTHGVHHDVRSVLRVSSALDGNLFTAASHPTGKRVMPKAIADEVTQALQGVVERGTGTAARQPFTVYGKTGTTDDFTDAWFTGCTRTLCITAWMGYDKPFSKSGVPHSLTDSDGQPVYGGTVPAQLFAATFADDRSLAHPASTASSSPTPTPYVAPPSPHPVVTRRRSETPKPHRSPTPHRSTHPTTSPASSAPASSSPQPSPTHTHRKS
jgi:penicillin-binding protein 1A